MEVEFRELRAAKGRGDDGRRGFVSSQPTSGGSQSVEEGQGDIITVSKGEAISEGSSHARHTGN